MSSHFARFYTKRRRCPTAAGLGEIATFTDLAAVGMALPAVSAEGRYIWCVSRDHGDTWLAQELPSVVVTADPNAILVTALSPDHISVGSTPTLALMVQVRFRLCGWLVLLGSSVVLNSLARALFASRLCG